MQITCAAHYVRGEGQDFVIFGSDDPLPDAGSVLVLCRAFCRKVIVFAHAISLLYVLLQYLFGCLLFRLEEARKP